MEIKLTLALPRDAISVPVVRRVLKNSMNVLGVDPEVVSDIELALTEACTNVLDHAGAGEEYEVSAGIDGDMCVIEVVDHGAGFDVTARGLAPAADGAENGRGIAIMRTLVDNVTFTSIPKDGNVLHFEKQLTWQEGSAIEKLTEGRPATEHGPWSAGERMADAPEPQAPRR